MYSYISFQRQDQAWLKEFETQISQRSEIMECYLMTGESDYMLRIVVHDIREFRDFMIGFLTALPNVSNLRSRFALSQIKYTTALSHCPDLAIRTLRRTKKCHAIILHKLCFYELYIL